MNTYKINTATRIMYQALGGQTGLTDVTAYVYNPSESLFATVTLSEILPGLYSNTFTPNVVGRWNVRITSSTYPANTTTEFYFVTNVDTLPASIITTGGIERLAVDAILSNSSPTITNVASLTSLGYLYSIALSLNMSTAGNDNPLILLKNPSGSGKRIYLYKANLGIDVVNVLSNFKIYSNPTITDNGTSQTPVNLFIGGGFGASAMNVYSIPTISNLGTIFQTYEVGQNNNSYDGIQDFSVQIAPNNNILLAANPGSNNRQGTITLTWAEF